MVAIKLLLSMKFSLCKNPTQGSSSVSCSWLPPLPILLLFWTYSSDSKHVRCWSSPEMSLLQVEKTLKVFERSRSSSLRMGEVGLMTFLEASSPRQMC
ncbi:hypothetical protein AHAS_Ahas13G0363200 [Arachis hypogaea]